MGTMTTTIYSLESRIAGEVQIVHGTHKQVMRHREFVLSLGGQVARPAYCGTFDSAAIPERFTPDKWR